MFPISSPRLFLAVIASLLPAAALAQTSGGYVFTKIVDGDTARPDVQGNFYLGFPQVVPSLDGHRVLFQDLTSSANSLWTANAAAPVSGLVKLADFSTTVPGGVGTFTRFDDQTARVQNGTVLFEGLDGNTTVQTHGGLYTVPASGGTIAKVIDYHTTAPESGYPFVEGNGNNQITQGVIAGDYDLENGLIAFHAITDGDAQGDNADGIYTVRLDGTGLTLLANRNNDGTPPPFPANQYYSVGLHNGTAVFQGATVFAGYGLFSSPATGGLSAPTLLASPGTALPGGQSPEMTTSYYFTSTQPAFNRFDHVTGNLIFAAHDGSGINGLYSLPASGLGAGVITRIVDNQTTLPGQSAPGASFDGSPFSADGGQVAFLTPGSNDAGQSQALYLRQADGSFSRVVGVGDVLDGITLTGITLGAHALSGGRVVFGAGSYLQGHDSARYGAIFVATPVAQTSDLALSLEASVDQTPLGKPVEYFLTVVNKGPAAADSFVVTDTLPAGETFNAAVPDATAVAGNVVTFNGGPLAVGASAVFRILATPTGPGPLVDSATVTGTAADADTTNNTAQNTVATIAQPVVTLAANVPGVVAGSGQIGEFTLSLSTASATDMIVNLTVKGTAVNGTDYVLLKTTKKIKAGKTGKPIKVIPQGNLGGVPKKTVVLTLQPGTGYTVGTTGKVKVKILAPAP